MTIRKAVLMLSLFISLIGAAFADIVAAGNGAVVKETFSTATSTSFTIPGVANICIGAVQECPQFANVVVSRDGTLAYAPFIVGYQTGVGSGVAIFDLKSNTYVGGLNSVCAMPRKVAIDSTDRLYIPCADGVSVVSTANNTVLYKIVFPSGISGADHVALLNDGTVITAAGPDGTVFSYAPGAVTPSASMRLGTAVHYFLISPDNTKIFAFLLESRNFIDSTGQLKTSSIVVLDTSLHVIDYVSTGNTTVEFATIAAGRIYAPAGNGNLYAIDPVSDTVLSSTFLGGYLTGIALGDDGKLYIADFFSNQVYSVNVGSTPGSDVVGDSFALPDNLNPTGIAALPIVALDPIQQLVKQLTAAVNGSNASPQLKTALLNFINSLPTRIASLTPTQKARLIAQTQVFIKLVKLLSVQHIISTASATQLVNLANTLIAILR
jgi:hypothetical protein